MANQTKRLARLIRDADKCAGGATAAVQSAIKDIKGRIALATQELNLAGKAADRDKLFAEIHDRISRLEGELTRYLNAAAEMGSTAGFQAGKDETGLQVKYSAERANAILETVTERNGGELAATFTQNMENEIVGALRTATVEAIRAQAITGGTLKGMSKDLAQRMKDAARDFTFTDSRGRKWDSAAYFQMNTRTNAMRIYNDTLADTIARATGSDLARISGGGDPNCKHCFPWEGRVISLTGKTPGFPTYEDARAAGCFHPNCVHTLEYLDETADADEIALQKQFPPERDEEGEITADAADENRYEIDIARKMADNPELDATAAKVLVDRDNLAASIRNGAIRADAEKIVAGLTDAQVAALCPDGNPPAFMAAKDNPDKGAEGWNKGSFGGKVYVKGDLTAARLLDIADVGKGKEPTAPDNATEIAKGAQGAVKAAAKASKEPPPKAEDLPKDEPPPQKNTLDEIAELKTVKDCVNYAAKKFDVQIGGIEKLPLETAKDILGIAEQARTFGVGYTTLSHIGTAQAMQKNTAEYDTFLSAITGNPHAKLEIVRFGLKGMKRGIYGDEAIWYGMCQDYRAIGTTAAQYIHSDNPIRRQFNGIYLNVKSLLETEKNKAQVENGWWCKGADTPKGTLYHEYGHVLDAEWKKRYGVKLSQMEEFTRIVNRHGGIEGVSTGLSRYGATSMSETLAEAWCEYNCTAKPRPLAKELGDFIIARFR